MKEANRSFQVFGRLELFSLVVLLLLALGMCLLLTAVPAKAADVTIVEYGANPVYDPPVSADRAYYPCVLYNADQFSSHGRSYYYKMWYGDVNGQWEAVTYSNDGISWTNPDQTAGIGVNGYHAQVLYFPGGFSATGGPYYYKIWYWNAPNMNYKISDVHTADSVDGVNFANDQALTQDATAQLVLDPDPGVGWNRGSYGPVSLLYNAAAKNTGANPFDYSFAMYYDGTTGGAEVIGLAYSSDGNHWSRYGSGPVLDLGPEGAWDGPLSGSTSAFDTMGTVIKGEDGTWRMWYSGWQYSTEATNYGIGYATSTDGINWTKDSNNPLFYYSDGKPWRDSRTYTPSVLYSPTRFDGHGAGAAYKMWFAGKASSTGNYTIGYAASPPTTVWVDTTYSPGSAGGHTYGYDAFNTVQGGINGVAEPGHVIVYAGTYNESLNINKHVIITGAGASTTIINGGDPYSVIIGATDVSFSGFTVMNPGYTGGSDASGIVIEPPTGSPSNIHVYNNIIHDIGNPNTPCTSYGRVGINIGAPDGPVEVDNNEIYNIKHNGSVGNVWANGFSIWGSDTSHPGTDVDIHDNSIHDIYCPEPRAAGISSQTDVKGLKIRNNTIRDTKDAGIETRGGSQDSTLIQNNTINGTVATYGINSGIKCSDPFPETVTANTVTGCQTGVLVENPEAGWGNPAVPPNVNLNRIAGNALNGLDNTLTASTDATKNWWGSAYGPWTSSHTGGDKVSGLATTNPWCTNSILTEICSFPTNLVPEMTAGIFSIPVGDTEPSTGYVNAADQVDLSVTGAGVTHTMTFPTGTKMTTSAGNFNTANLVATYVAPASLSGFSPNTIVRAGLRFGLPGSTLDFSSPVTVRMQVGSALNGRRLTVFRSVTGSSGWTVDGIETATPLVSGGAVTFTATKASYYAVVTPGGSVVTGSSFYFAEGYTGRNFAEYLCVANPNVAAATAHVKYLFVDGTSREADYPVPGQSRITVFVNDVVGRNREVSMVVQSTTSNLVAERPMYFDYNGAPGDLNWTGGHDVIGATKPGLSWYFAEGYTGPRFDDFVTVLNPGSADAALTFRFQTQEAGEIVKSGYKVRAHSRGTFKINDLLGANYQTSLKLESNQPVVAERPMYFDYTGVGRHSWTGGSCVVGAPALAKQYYFAEGTTRYSGSDGEFEEWLTLQNPGTAAIKVNATYQLGQGQGENVTKSYIVGPGKRSTVLVSNEVGKNKDVSVLLTSGSDFLAERPQYFNYKDKWTGGDCVVGSTATGTNWCFAEGYTGPGFQEWLTIQNPGTGDAAVEITYFTQDQGTKGPYKVTVPAKTRQTIYVNKQAGSNLQLSARLISNRPVVVERPMYFDYLGSWTGGHVVIGRRY